MTLEPGFRPITPVVPPGSAGDEAPVVEVEHAGGDRFQITVRSHRIEVDQPILGGGEDTAPTPTELLIAALASCVAFYGRRFLKRHRLPEDISVRAGWTSGTKPARVAEIHVEVSASGLPEGMRPRFSNVIEHCAVHNTLRSPPIVEIQVVDDDAGEIAS